MSEHGPELAESFWSTPRWALVEVKGFRRHVALCSEVENFGGKMLRCDISENVEGTVSSTIFYPGSSLHAITPITDEYAKKLLSQTYSSRTQAIQYAGSDDDSDQEAFQ